MERSCRVQGCKREYKAKGYCNVHYKKWRQGDLPKSRYKICTKEECKKPRVKMGLCQEHLDILLGERLKKKTVVPKAEATAPESAEQVKTQAKPEEKPAPSPAQDASVPQAKE